MKTSLVNRSPTDSGIRLGRTFMHDATLLVGPQWAWDIGRRRLNNQVIIPMSHHHWQKVFHWRNRRHQQQHLEPRTAHQLQAANRRQRLLVGHNGIWRSWMRRVISMLSTFKTCDQPRCPGLIWTEVVIPNVLQHGPVQLQRPRQHVPAVNHQRFTRHRVVSKKGT